jgi:D-alanyl-D-alanine carboxypeptidase
MDRDSRLSRRRLLVLGLAVPFAGAWPVGAVEFIHAATPVHAALPDQVVLRDLARDGLEWDVGGTLTRVFGLPPEVAGEVLLRATRDDALPDGYRPGDLVDAAARGLPTSGGQLIRALIVDDTRALIADAANGGLELYVGSGFRSQAYQASVFSAQVARWGDPDTANRYSARAGHSHHQLGTAIDFTVSFRAFRDSPAPTWLRENAHRFGFVLPYTTAASARTGYVDEPWHARWVGSALASRLQSIGYQDWTDLDADDAVAVVRTEAGLDA